MCPRCVLSLDAPCRRAPISHDDHVPVCACVTARMSLHVYSYSLYWWALQLVLRCVTVGVFVLFAGAVYDGRCWRENAERERERARESARESERE